MGEKITISGKRRRIRISHILILLLVIAIGAFTFFRINIKHKLNARIEAIRAAGYPVTLEELDKWYSIPDDTENAAYVILNAIEYYQQDQNDFEYLPFVGNVEIPNRNEPLPEDVMKHVLHFLEDNQKCLELLYKIAELKYGRYPIDLKDGFDTLLPHLSHIYTSMKLLQLNAVYQADCNEPELAIKSIKSIFGLFRSLEMEPLIISQLSRSSIRNRVYQTIERIMNRIEFQEDELLRLQELFMNNNDLSGMERGFIGQTCSILDVINNITIIDGKSLGIDMFPVPVLEAFKALGLVDRETVIYLDLQQEYQTVFELPLNERIKAIHAVEDKHKDALKKCFILRDFMPELDQAMKVDLRNIASIQTVLAVFAVERFRLTNGKLPDSLDNLVPDYLESVPLDPFDGQEIRYKRLDKGFVIYSIGDDLIDDGGMEMLKDGKQTNNSKWDITFIVEK